MTNEEGTQKIKISKTLKIQSSTNRAPCVDHETEYWVGILRNE